MTGVVSRSRIGVGFAVALLLVALAPAEARAAEEDHLPHHHVSFLLGAMLETKRDPETQKDKAESGFAFGVDYRLQFSHHWEVGVVFEAIGRDTIRDFVTAAHVSYGLDNGLRFFGGPGVEFTEKKNKLLLRLGLGYEFHLSEKWTLSPEGFVDYIEGGAVTWVGGLSLGFGF